MSIILWLQHYAIVAGFVVFILLVVSCCRPSRKQEMDRSASIPLDDDP